MNPDPIPPSAKEVKDKGPPFYDREGRGGRAAGLGVVDPGLGTDGLPAHGIMEQVPSQTERQD